MRKTPSKVDSFQDGLVEGTTAFGKGLFNGLSGVVRKPIRGAKEDGIAGFFEGAAKVQIVLCQVVRVYFMFESKY